MLQPVADASRAFAQELGRFQDNAAVGPAIGHDRWVANSASEGSRLVAAADVIGFLRCPSVGGGRFPLRENRAVRQRVIAR